MGLILVVTDDIDHAAKRVAAVKQCAGPFDDLDPLGTQRVYRLTVITGLRPTEPLRTPSCKTSTRSPSNPRITGRDDPGPKLRFATPVSVSRTSPRDVAARSAIRVEPTELTVWNESNTVARFRTL